MSDISELGSFATHVIFFFFNKTQQNLKKSMCKRRKKNQYYNSINKYELGTSEVLCLHSLCKWRTIKKNIQLAIEWCGSCI